MADWVAGAEARLERRERVWEVRKQTMQAYNSFKDYGNKGQKTGRQLKTAVSQGRVDFNSGKMRHVYT